MMISKLSLALLAATNLVACIDDGGIGEDGEMIEELGQTEQAIGSCNYSLVAAAITKQIVSIEEPVQILVELVTVTAKPYSMQATSWTYPAGFRPISLATTSCTEQTNGMKCRHTGVIEQTTATSGTGAYAMNFTPTAAAGSGCGNGTSQRIDFSLTTETFEPYQLDASDAEVLLFPAWQYGGTPYGLQLAEGQTIGYVSFVGADASVNDVVSSIKIKPGYSVTLFQHANYSGRAITLTADHPWLGEAPLYYNDLASSAVIRKL